MFMADLRVVNRTFDPAEWQQDAACRNHPTSLFYPPHGVSHAQVDAARAICATCSVQEECLTYALDNKEIFGIWGGLSERQRRRIRRDTRHNVVRYLTNGSTRPLDT
jgi:WhiB family redox-sensing transcriptional regulator